MRVNVRGRRALEIVTALRSGPKTLGELAAIVYGADDWRNREAATRVIARLRRIGQPIDSEWQYAYRDEDVAAARRATRLFD